jgi:hypothetical protein
MFWWSVAAGLATALAVWLQIRGWRWAPAVLLAAQAPWAVINVLADAPGLWISWSALTLVALDGLRRALSGPFVGACDSDRNCSVAKTPR